MNEAFSEFGPAELLILVVSLVAVVAVIIFVWSYWKGNNHER